MPDSQIPAQHPPVLQDIPIGIDAHGERREFDSMGDVQVPAGKYWGAQTQRSLVHFSIGNDKMPKEVYHAYGTVKKACALVNEAALASGDVDEATYDKVMDPMSMVGHGAGGA